MKVSILIPCYNAEQWVGHAIQTALDQTWPDKEVIVVDDGSTDRSLEIIRSFRNQIRWETGPNQGGNVARNRLLELASGEWLQYLDADDYLQPNKIEGQLRGSYTSSADVIYSPVTMEYWTGSQAVHREVLGFDGTQDPWVLLIRWILPQTGASLWRASAVRDVGAWKVDQPCCQEHELYLRLLAAGKQFAYCPARGAVYRQWSTETICRRDPLHTFQRRLAVVRQCELHLLACGQLTIQRSNAIAITRVECARSMYPLDSVLAIGAAGTAKNTGLTFRLPAEPAFPLAYRVLYRWIGFRHAERIAAIIRRFRRQIGHSLCN